MMWTNNQPSNIKTARRRRSAWLRGEKINPKGMYLDFDFLDFSCSDKQEAELSFAFIIFVVVRMLYVK